MRIAVAGLLHETNTFAAHPTTLADFAAAGIYRGPELTATFAGSTGTPGGILDTLRELGAECVPLLYSFGTPSGTVAHTAYAALRDEILDRLAAAGPVDGVARVRAAVGPRVPVVATLDLHGNLTPRMAEHCDAWVAYKTYPHVDYYPRAAEASRIVCGAAAGRIRPVMHLGNLPLLPVVQCMLTEAGPMQRLMALAAAHEREPGVLNVTVMGGFPYSDVHWAGMSVSAVSDGDPEQARQICDSLAAAAWALREEFRHRSLSVAEGVAQAMAASETPVALVDASDNVGGGSAADGTAVLAELLARGATGAVVTLYDPAAVAAAAAAGEGATVALTVGGKTDRQHGDHVPVRGQVRRLSDGAYVSERVQEPRFMGPTAVLACGGVEVVLTSLRVPAFDVAALRSVGIEPEARRIIVIKGAVQWRSSFGQVCRSSVEVDAPGVTSANLARFTYRRLRRPLFPLDDII